MLSLSLSLFRKRSHFRWQVDRVFIFLMFSHSHGFAAAAIAALLLSSMTIAVRLNSFHLWKNFMTPNLFQFDMFNFSLELSFSLSRSIYMFSSTKWYLKVYNSICMRSHIKKFTFAEHMLLNRLFIFDWFLKITKILMILKLILKKKIYEKSVPL